MTAKTPNGSVVSRRSLVKGIAGAATLAVPAATILGPGRSYAADKKVTVGMAWPGMQDAVWSTSKNLL
jgi:hypothetical protein